MTPPDPTPAATDAVTLPLRRLPLWSQGLSLMVQFAVLVALSCLIEVLPRAWRAEPLRSEAFSPLTLPLMCIGAVGLAVVKRLWVRLRPLPPVTFDADGVRLPPHPESWRRVSVPYAEVVGVLEAGMGRRRLLIVESRRQIFSLPDRMFVAPDGADQMATLLRRRILELPQGGELVEGTRRRRADAQARMAQPAWVSQALAGVMAVMFAACWAKGSLEGAFDLIRWGAMVPVKVGQGEFFRPLAASFLHTGAWQALVCIATFYALASLVERLLGWPRLAVLVASGGAVVMASQALQGRVVSVGASGCTFALLGSFAQLSRRLRLVLPLAVLQPGRWWAFVIGLHLVFTLLWPLTDPTVLVVGFAWGLLATQAMLGRPSLLPPVAPRGWRVAGALSLTAMAASLLAGVDHARRNRPDEDLEVGGVLLARGGEAAQARVALALGWLSHVTTGPTRLRCARALAERDRQLAPAEPLYADTLARALGRLRELDPALEEARAAVDLSGGKMLFAMNLGRLLARRYQAQGPVVPAGVAPDAARLHVDAATGEVLLDALPPGGPWQIYALVRHRERPLALVMASAPAATALPLAVSRVPSWQRQQMSRFELVVAYMADLSRVGAGAGPRPQLGLVPILSGPQGGL